jgi:hypothetical protein
VAPSLCDGVTRTRAILYDLARSCEMRVWYHKVCIKAKMCPGILPGKRMSSEKMQRRRACVRGAACWYSNEETPQDPKGPQQAAVGRVAPQNLLSSFSPPAWHVTVRAGPRTKAGSQQHPSLHADPHFVVKLVRRRPSRVPPARLCHPF